MCNQLFLSIFLFCVVLHSTLSEESDKESFPTTKPTLHQCDNSVTSDPACCASEGCGFQDELEGSDNITAACPLGFYCNGTCKCLDAPDQIVSCKSHPKLKFSVLDCNCATYNPHKKLVTAGPCVYNCENPGSKSLSDIVYHDFPPDNSSLNDYMCSDFNRTGTLCGKCSDGQYPLAYSFNLTCIKCPHPILNWVWYIMAAYIPLTFFYIFVLFFKINAVSSHLHPVILYSQLVSAPALSRIIFLAVQNRPKTFKGVKVVLSFYGIWNLDFFRPYYSTFCLGIGTLPTLALEYAIALYPLLLMVVSYLLLVLHDKNYKVITLLCTPFRVLFTIFKRSWDIRTSIIDVYSTFFLLSNVKILSISFDLLAPARVYHLYPDHYNYTYHLYYAGDIEYFSKEHLPYAILALFLLLIFFFLPVVTLTLYPFRFFQKMLNLFPVRWYVLHTFVDAFHGCYKDGTQPGTRDCRWFAALYLFLRFIFCFVYSLTLNALFFPLCSLFVLLLIMLVIVIQPYKPQMASHAKTNSVFLILYAMFYACISGSDSAGIKGHHFTGIFYTLAVLISLVPLLCMLGFLCYWLFSGWKFVSQSVRAFQRGYVIMAGSLRDGEEYCDRVINPQNYPVLPAAAPSLVDPLPASSRCRRPAEASPTGASQLKDCSQTLLKD